jgi:hypothetical protein
MEELDVLSQVAAAYALVVLFAYYGSSYYLDRREHDMRNK